MKQIGPQAFIQEQLAPEAIEESLEEDKINLNADWQRVVVSGTASAGTLYIYMTGPGDCYIDDIRIVAGENPDVGANRVQNGGL